MIILTELHISFGHMHSLITCSLQKVSGSWVLNQSDWMEQENGQAYNYSDR